MNDKPRELYHLETWHIEAQRQVIGQLLTQQAGHDTAPHASTDQGWPSTARAFIAACEDVPGRAGGHPRSPAPCHADGVDEAFMFEVGDTDADPRHGDGHGGAKTAGPDYVLQMLA